MRFLDKSALGSQRNPRRLSSLFCAYLAILGLTVLVVGSIGCEPEMPKPPQRQSTNPAEDSFHWAMERMEHAIEMFQPPSSLGLQVKHSVEHKLFPPKEGKPNYTASVIISTRAVFNHAPTAAVKDRRKAQEDKAREAAKKLGLDDPFGPSDEERLTGDPLAMDEPGSVEMRSPNIAEPAIAAQRMNEKNEYDLEYKNDEWQLTTESVEDNERMWFDYALQQGEFAPAAGKP
jgi:hypothetical protein